MHWDDGPGGGCASRVCRAPVLTARRTRHAGLSPAGTGIAACLSERLVCPGARVPLVRLASPCQIAPGSPSLRFIHRRFRPRITAGYTCGKRSAYLCAIAAWRVDSFSFFFVHRARIALSQVKTLLRARPGNTIPSISPMCAQARRPFAQVIHMVVHSKARNTFSCRAGRQQRVSVPLLARGGRHAGRGSGLGPDDIAHDGGHRMPAARPAGQAARAPRRLPAVTLTVIPPAARPRHAQAARAPPPPALALRPARPRPRAGAGGAGPHRRPGSAADHRPATADAGALAPGGVSARDGAAPGLAG